MDYPDADAAPSFQNVTDTDEESYDGLFRQELTSFGIVALGLFALLCLAPLALCVTLVSLKTIFDAVMSVTFKAKGKTTPCTVVAVERNPDYIYEGTRTRNAKVTVTYTVDGTKLVKLFPQVITDYREYVIGEEVELRYLPFAPRQVSGISQIHRIDSSTSCWAIVLGMACLLINFSLFGVGAGAFAISCIAMLFGVSQESDFSFVWPAIGIVIAIVTLVWFVFLPRRLNKMKATIAPNVTIPKETDYVGRNGQVFCRMGGGKKAEWHPVVVEMVNVDGTLKVRFESRAEEECNLKVPLKSFRFVESPTGQSESDDLDLEQNNNDPKSTMGEEEEEEEEDLENNSRVNMVSLHVGQFDKDSSPQPNN